MTVCARAATWSTDPETSASAPRVVGIDSPRPHRPRPPRRSPLPGPTARPRPPGPPTAWMCIRMCSSSMVSHRPGPASPVSGRMAYFPDTPLETLPVATFLKTTEISIDGARTLPREYYTSPEIFGHELEHIFTKRWLCVGREDRIPNPGDWFTQQIGKESIIVLRDREGGYPRVLQRLPPSRHAALRGAQRPVQRHDPVPLPRLDLRARRPPHRGAVHRRDRELRQGRLAAPPGGAGRLGRVPVHQPRRRARAVRPGLARRCSAGSAGSTCRT